MFPDWIAVTLDVLRNDPDLRSYVPASSVLARYAEPGDPPRLVTVVPAGGGTVEPEALLRVQADVRCWAETGPVALRIWQLVHRALTSYDPWTGRGVARWRLSAGPSLVADPNVALVQVLATYETFVYEVAA